MMDAGQWVALATVVSACATAAIAILTIFLVIENRKLRQAGKEPQVIAYLAPHPDGNGAINIVFENVGLGLAKNVAFSIECDEADFEAHHVLIQTHNGKAPINALPAGEKIVAIFGVGFELFGNLHNNKLEPLKPFSVRFDFTDLDGRKGSTTTTIDIRQFDGLLGMMNKPALREIQDTLKSMDQRFDVLAAASKKFVEFVDVTSVSHQVRQVRKSDRPKSATRRSPK